MKLKNHTWILEKSKYESFITGIDDEGELIYENCGEINRDVFKLTYSKDDEGEKSYENSKKIDRVVLKLTCFKDDEGERDRDILKLTYFKKEVLNKYYNEPNKYQVDGFSVESEFFILKIDNNVDEYIPVFFRYLREFPEVEQLHWKQYNIPPKEGMNMSQTYYEVMVEEKWGARPRMCDLYFKSEYKNFNKKWEEKFGWKLYKPLSKKDEYLFTALHKITSNNIKAFCEQTLTIVKLTIDRIKRKRISKRIRFRF